MTQKSRHDPQLQSLERWRTAALEYAQTEHVQRRKIVDKRAQVVDQVQSTIDESQDLARAHASAGSVISVESLTRIRHFSAVQSIALQQAAASLEQSKQEVAQALTTVCSKFEELAVVERLRERRSDEASKELLRKEQRRLDDQAALKLTRSLHDRRNQKEWE